MKNLIEFILIHLCQHPEEVVVDEEITDRENIYTIHVHPEDMGRIIGKGGSVIHAIRTVAKIRAIKEEIRIRINVADQEPSEAS